MSHDERTGGGWLQLTAPSGLGEVRAGDDLADLVRRGLPDLRDGDIVAVTSKVVAKAEGRVGLGDREAHIDAESVRLVARRGPTRIVVNRQGLVQAAAGVDASNTEPGTVVLLPEDPDASARRLREGLVGTANVAIVVTDTAGRAWRHGQTDLAVGCAGLDPLEDHAGRTDSYGNPLLVTAPAVADELAGAAELVTGKTSGRPVCLIRGLAERVLPRGDHGPGARTLQRPVDQDMFALGAREAVLAALGGAQAEAFGSPVSEAELVESLTALDLGLRLRRTTAGSPADGEPESGGWLAELVGTSAAEGPLVRAVVAAHALGWVARPGPGGLELHPRRRTEG